MWAVAQAWGAVPESFVVEPRVETLDNGLVVVLAEDHRTDTVALHLVYGVGSRDETEAERGCAHLFEHLMFEGSAFVPTNAFDDWLTSAGGWNNAYTSRDVTAYFMEFPSGALDLALFLESDRMAFLEAGLLDENLDNQQKVVLQEREEGYAEPNGRDFDALGRISWPADHPYHHPVIGTVADIEGFTLEASSAFWQRHYRPSNAVLVLVGSFDTEGALDRVRHWFSDVPDRGAAAQREVAPLVGGVRGNHGKVEDQVEERTLYMTWETVPEGHPDAAALDVLTYVMADGRGTRLEDRLYFDRQRTSAIGMFHWASDRAGRVILYASSPKVPLPTIRKLVDKELARLLKRPPTQADVDRALRSMEGEIHDQLEIPRRKAQLLAECYRTRGRADCLAEEWGRVLSVTPEDVVRVARTYLVEQSPNTLSNIPVGDEGAIEGAVAVELP